MEGLKKNNHSPGIRLAIGIFFLALALRLEIVFLPLTLQLLPDDPQYSASALSITQCMAFTLSTGKPIAFQDVVSLASGDKIPACRLIRAFFLAFTCVFVLFWGDIYTNGRCTSS